MKLFPVPKTGLHVALRLRDERCPPHVHVESSAALWEARFEFSYVGNKVGLMDIDPINAAPTIRTIDAIRRAIAGHLPKCRQAWWEKIGTCCLDRRWVAIDNRAVTVLARHQRNARQIRTAYYGAADGSLALHFAEPDDHRMLAGEGIDP